MPYSLIDDDVSSVAPVRRPKTAYRRVSGLVSGYRYFCANLSRWISRDPIWESGGLMLYGYCGNDGVTFIDYLGLMGGDFGHVQAGEIRNEAFSSEERYGFLSAALAGSTCSCKCGKDNK